MNCLFNMSNKVLIAYEKSQVIASSMRDKGIEAYSCDLLPCTGGLPEIHIQGDAMKIITSDYWRLVIIHPECIKVCVSGNHVYAKGKKYHYERLNQVRYIQGVWDLTKKHSDMLCMENPVGVLNTLGNFPKPQYIQPYEFGHCESKKTGLWLHRLPELIPTKRVYGRFVNGFERFDNQTDSGQNRLPPSNNRSSIRSKTYKGIADAMADQYGKLI